MGLLDLFTDFDFALGLDVAGLEALMNKKPNLQALAEKAGAAASSALGGAGGTGGASGAAGSIGGFTEAGGSSSTDISPRDSNPVNIPGFSQMPPALQEQLKAAYKTPEEKLSLGDKLAQGGAKLDSNIAGALSSTALGGDQKAFLQSPAMIELDGVLNGAKDIKGLMNLKNDIMNAVQEIQAGNISGVMMGLAGKLSDSKLMGDLVGGITGGILELESLKALANISNNLLSLVDKLGAIGLEFLSLDEEIFDNTVLNGMLKYGAKASFDNGKTFMKFVYSGDYWKTLEYTYGKDTELKSRLIRLYKTYARRAFTKGAKDCGTTILKLKLFNAADKREVNDLASYMMKLVITVTRNNVTMAFLYDYLAKFGLEPGLMSDDDSYILEVSNACNADGYRLSNSEVDRLLPIKTVKNPITGKPDQYIDPSNDSIVSVLKLLMSNTVFQYPLVHEYLKERLKLPIYNKLLHGQLTEALRDLLKMLGLDELIPLVVTKEGILDAFITHYNPQPVKKLRSYSSYTPSPLGAGLLLAQEFLGIDIISQKAEIAHLTTKKDEAQILVDEGTIDASVVDEIDEDIAAANTELTNTEAEKNILDIQIKEVVTLPPTEDSVDVDVMEDAPNPVTDPPPVRREYIHECDCVDGIIGNHTVQVNKSPTDGYEIRDNYEDE